MNSNFCLCCVNVVSRIVANSSVPHMSRRCYISKGIKRFYKHVTISEVSDGEGYEINLDKRKLKTPLGNLFVVPTEPLALGVATEWQGQKQQIKKHNMHLTSLCNTAIDNPTRRDRDTVINHILEFLNTDTLCYRVDAPPELVKLQSESWDPILLWLKDRYSISLEPTYSISPPVIPSDTRARFKRHLNFYDSWVLVGYQELVENLKSLALTCALVDRAVSVETAVKLSRLEQEFQTEKWGNVEWYHDIDLVAVQSRVAAALLFVHLTSQSWSVKHKQKIPLPV